MRAEPDHRRAAEQQWRRHPARPRPAVAEARRQHDRRGECGGGVPRGERRLPAAMPRPRKKSPALCESRYGRWRPAIVFIPCTTAPLTRIASVPWSPAVAIPWSPNARPSTSAPRFAAITPVPPMTLNAPTVERSVLLPCMRPDCSADSIFRSNGPASSAPPANAITHFRASAARDSSASMQCTRSSRSRRASAPSSSHCRSPAFAARRLAPSPIAPTRSTAGIAATQCRRRA